MVTGSDNEINNPIRYIHIYLNDTLMSPLMSLIIIPVCRLPQQYEWHQRLFYPLVLHSVLLF